MDYFCAKFQRGLVNISYSNSTLIVGGLAEKNESGAGNFGGRKDLVFLGVVPIDFAHRLKVIRLKFMQNI